MGTLVEDHFRLALHIAHRECKRLGYWDVDELISVACLALMRSAKTFSESVGVKFSTYCGRLIEWEVRSEVRRQRRRIMDRVPYGSTYQAHDTTDRDELSEAIEKLSTSHQALIGRILSGESINEIALQRGTSRQSVRQQLELAKDKLRKLIKA